MEGLADASLTPVDLSVRTSVLQSLTMKDLKQI